MIKTFKYRIYPTHNQELMLTSWLSKCQKLYNHLLQERIDTYKNTGKGISKYDQQKKLTLYKKLFPEYQSVYADVLYDITDRIDIAFQGFFRRCKSGEKPGYPRFKAWHRYDSFRYWSKWGYWVENKRIKLSKIGSIKCKFDRIPSGKFKNLTVKRTSAGRWFICICSDVEKKPMPKTNKVVGIDVGCKSFLTDSTGNKVDNPHFFKHSEKQLVERQQKLSRKKKGSKRRAKAKLLVAKAYEHIKNQRRDFHFKTAKKLITENDLICIENLTHFKAEWKNLRKSISDVAWQQFFDILVFKAEEAGKQVIKVDPKNTSQRCSGCDVIVPKDLSTRVHSCKNCGLVLDRDHNAALNILQAGLACQHALVP